MSIVNTTFSKDLGTPKYAQCGQSWSSSTTSCGGTMCSEGCYITSTAMVFKGFGSTVDPGTLLSNLKSTSSDCPLDWYKAASNYGHSVHDVQPGTFDNLKAAIFDYVYQNSTPVILCVSGSTTHAVVIKGFYGVCEMDTNNPGVPVASSITSQMFQVNDPGNSSNTTLDQVFAKYPTTVKFVVYYS